MEPLLRLLAIGIRTRCADLRAVADDVGRALACTFGPIPFEPEAETGRPMLRASMGLYRVLLEQVEPDQVSFSGYCKIGHRPLGDGIDGTGWFIGLLQTSTGRRWYLPNPSGSPLLAMLTRPLPPPPSPQAAFLHVRLPATSLEPAAVLVEKGLGVVVSRAPPVWTARVLGIDATLCEDADGVVLTGASEPYGNPPLDLSLVVKSLLEHGLAQIG